MSFERKVPRERFLRELHWPEPAADRDIEPSEPWAWLEEHRHR